MTELTARQQELLDEMLKDFKGDTRNIFGEGGLLKTIGKRTIEAALNQFVILYGDRVPVEQ